MQRGSQYKWYCALFEREFALEEVVKGLLGYDLPSDLRQQLVAETTNWIERSRKEEVSGSMWNALNEENGGTPEKPAIPSPKELWKIYDSGGDIEAYMPASKGKRDTRANIQYALWGGVLDVLDATGLIYTYGSIGGFGIDNVFNALKEIATRLGLKVEEFTVPADKSPTGEEMKSLRLSIPAPAPQSPAPQPPQL